MGDMARDRACAVFIRAFGEDIIKRFRSKLLDETFGERVEYSVDADHAWEVGLYAEIYTEPRDVESFRVERAPVFAPDADDIASICAKIFNMTEEEARERLKKSEAEV